MGYAREGTEGKGLSDSAQRSYNEAKRATLKTGYDRYLFDVESMLVKGTNQLKGMYQLPGSPEYAGGKGTVPYIRDLLPGAPIGGLRTSTVGYGSGAPNTIGNSVASQPGGMGWFRKGSGLGVPPSKENDEARSLLTMGGLAYIVLKVLL